MVVLWAWVYCVYALVPSWKFYCKLSETCLKYNLIPLHISFYRYGIEIITNFESDWLAKILIFFTSPSVTARWDYTCGKHTVFKPKNTASPKLVSWQVLRSLWCLEKRAMTGHSCGYGFCPIWGCELNWIGFVSKWTMWLFWKQGCARHEVKIFPPKQSHSVIPWMRLIVVSIVQLEDARAIWSVSCPIAL